MANFLEKRIQSVQTPIVVEIRCLVSPESGGTERTESGATSSVLQFERPPCLSSKTVDVLAGVVIAGGALTERRVPCRRMQVCVAQSRSRRHHLAAGAATWRSFWYIATNVDPLQLAHTATATLHRKPGVQRLNVGSHPQNLDHLDSNG